MNVLSQMRQKRKQRSGDAGRSITDNPELCMIEAELAAEGRADNYHIPSGESVLGEVQARCERNDLDPAWVVVDEIE